MITKKNTKIRKLPKTNQKENHTMKLYYTNKYQADAIAEDLTRVGFIVGISFDGIEYELTIDNL